MTHFSIKDLQLKKVIVEYGKITENIPFSFKLSEILGSRTTIDTLRGNLVAMQFHSVLMSNCIICDCRTIRKVLKFMPNRSKIIKLI